MKIIVAFFVAFMCVSCKQKRIVQITESCSIVNVDGRFDLVINTSSRKDTCRDIDRIGWDKNTIVLHQKSSPKGWVFIMDAGEVGVKSWGVYSDKEFVLRRKELDVDSHYKVFSIRDAWNKSAL